MTARPASGAVATTGSVRSPGAAGPTPSGTAVPLPAPWARDRFLQEERRWWVPDRVWSRDGAMLLVQRSTEHPDATMLAALGPAEPVADLVRGYAEGTLDGDGDGGPGPRPGRGPRSPIDPGAHRSAWVETSALGLLEPSVRQRLGLVPTRTGWEWLVTESAPPGVAGEDLVRELDPARDAEAIGACLAAANPTTDADPGAPHERWWGSPDGSGGLRGVIGAAARDGRPGGSGARHLHGLGVRPGERGQGLGAALTAAAVRVLLADGADWVSLGMWDDNDSARRIYHRLGLRTVHRMTTLRRP